MRVPLGIPMNKETIELARFEGSIFGYGWITQPKETSEEFALNKLVEWSKNKNVKIYSHATRRVEENLSKIKFHYACQNGGSNQEDNKRIYESCPRMQEKGNYKIPYCDTVYYLDIWYQPA